MPITMIIKETPVYCFLAKDSFDLPHFPAHLLQDNSYDLNPINFNIDELMNLAFSIKFNTYPLEYLFKVLYKFDWFILIFF